MIDIIGTITIWVMILMTWIYGVYQWGRRSFAKEILKKKSGKYHIAFYNGQPLIIPHSMIIEVVEKDTK